MTKKISRALTGALMILVSSVVVQPSTGHATTITSTINGFATDFSPQDGFGDLNNPILVSVSNNFPVNKQDRGIIEFNISPLSGAVSSASLRLLITDNNVPVPGAVLAVFGYTGNGALSNSDYEISASSIGSFNVVVFQAGSISVDVTNFINAQIALNDPAHFAGFRIVWNSAPS